MAVYPSPSPNLPLGSPPPPLHFDLCLHTSLQLRYTSSNTPTTTDLPTNLDNVEEQMIRLPSALHTATFPSLTTALSQSRTKSLTNSKKAPFTIHSLPPETLCEIFEHAVAGTFYEERCDLLRVCSLVCLAWSYQARVRLWHDVEVWMEETAQLVLTSLAFGRYTTYRLYVGATEWGNVTRRTAEKLIVGLIGVRNLECAGFCEGKSLKLDVFCDQRLSCTSSPLPRELFQILPRQHKSLQRSIP